MLTPTRIYVKEILEVFKKIDVHGLAHITGSGLWNIPRLKEKVKYVIERSFRTTTDFYLPATLREHR